MAGVTRNSLKGYTFQQYILTLFVAKMDTALVNKNWTRGNEELERKNEKLD